jgi:hypothetical protein
MAKPDDESQRTGPSDFVLCRDRHCPRRGRHSRPCDAIHGHPGIHRAQSRERGVDAHGQRTRYARRDLRERGPEITTLRLVAAARLAGRDPEEATDCAIKAW